MAEISNSAIIGAFSVRPTDTGADNQLETLRRYDSSLGSVGHDRMHQLPASFYQIDLGVFAQIGAGGTGNGCAMACPWPLTVWAADVGVEALSAGDAAVDIQKEPAAGGGYATILDAAEAVQSAVGEPFRVAPEVGQEDFDFGDKIRVSATQSGAGGTIDGAQAHLYVQRR